MTHPHPEAHPPEPRGGQDEAPDVDTAVHATIVTLQDVIEFLDRNTDDAESRDDLLLRVAALRRALIRLRDSREKTVDGRDPVPPGAVD